jgi:hypothetical protein
MMNPRIADTINLALTNPSFYVSGLLAPPGSVDPMVASLDTCLLYRYLGECNLYVNLHDLFVNFSHALDDKASERETAHDSGVMMRFTHAIAELQHMGIISACTGTRKEHYERTTWFNLDSARAGDS